MAKQFCILAISLFLLVVAILWPRSPSLAPSEKSGQSLASVPAKPGSDRKALKAANGDRSEERKIFRELVEGIRQDNYCAVSARLGRISEVANSPEPDRSILPYRALEVAFGSRQIDQCILASLARTRADVLRFTNQSDRVECRLVRGLLLSDQWFMSHEGVASTQREKQEGLAILKELASSEPGNGFLAFLELGAYEEEEKIAQEDAYQRFLRARSFANPLRSKFMGEFRRLLHQNSTSWLLTSSLYSSMGTPSFSLALKRAHSLAREGLYAADFESWMKGIQKRFETIDQLRVAEPFVDLIEDSVLRSVVIKGRLFVEPLPPVFEQAAWVGYFRRRTQFSLGGIVRGDMPCNELLETVRIAYPNWMREDDAKAIIALRADIGAADGP